MSVEDSSADRGNDLGRCLTGITDLDKILGGGIPRGNVVLIAGNVGTGKTTLSTEFLINGVNMNEKGMFISVTETSVKLISNLKHYDFFNEGMIKSRDLLFINAISIYELLGLKKGDLTLEDIYLLIKAIIDMVKKQGIKRLVIDSITSMAYRFKSEEKIRNFILLLSREISDMGCTAMLVSEVSSAGNNRYSVLSVEEAITDGIIVLGNMERGGDLLRTLQIVKMRGTPHSRAKYVMDLTPLGILMVPLLRGDNFE
ncbi:MAG: circadian clock protein KaiC [Candidatus Thermoplasmatota archaeon]|nr:circadian clock protein KaiC [Candidatus Thermoplasmatota archaeon]MCL5963674.1 circadian clock protein KaiC [Candidatus Thermoplasmatota archaeon]